MSIVYRCGAVVALLLAFAAPAKAAGATVTVSPATADPDYATVLTLRGNGFQSIPKAYGGLYVFFGWVSGAGWQPSQGGAAGETYRYVQDRETKDNNGFQRFVAFPGGDTQSAANGGVLAADGTWSAQLVVPGARFRTVDRAGSVVEVDCTRVQCGVITIGAHGVVNPSNETFTPVSFAAPPQQQAAPPPSSSAPPTTTSKAQTTTTTPPKPSTSAPAPPSTSAEPAPLAATSDSGPGWPVFAAAGAALLASSLTALAVVAVLRRRARTNPTSTEGN